MNELTLSEAARLLGLTYPVLSGWAKEGLVPLASENPRRLGLIGLVTAEVLAELKGLGFECLDQAAEAVRSNWRSGAPEHAGLLLVTSDRVHWSLGIRSLLAHAIRELTSPAARRQVVLLDLGLMAQSWATAPATEPATVIELDGQRDATALAQEEVEDASNGIDSTADYQGGAEPDSGSG